MSEHPDHDAMAELYRQATSPEIAKHMVGRLTHGYILDRLTSGNLEISLEAMSDPGAAVACQAEFEIEELAEKVSADVTSALSEAIERLGTPAGYSTTTPRSSTRATSCSSRPRSSAAAGARILRQRPPGHRGTAPGKILVSLIASRLESATTRSQRGSP